MCLMTYMLGEIYKCPCITHVHGVLVDKGFDVVLRIKINMLIACVRSHLMLFTEV